MGLFNRSPGQRNHSRSQNRNSSNQVNQRRGLLGGRLRRRPMTSAEIAKLPTKEGLKGLTPLETADGRIIRRDIGLRGTIEPKLDDLLRNPKRVGGGFGEMDKNPAIKLICEELGIPRHGYGMAEGLRKIQQGWVKTDAEWKAVNAHLTRKDYRGRRVVQSNKAFFGAVSGQIDGITLAKLQKDGIIIVVNGEVKAGPKGLTARI